MVEDLQRSFRAASTGLLVPLSRVQVGDPKRIALREWLALSIDERAPVRSVAMVEVAGSGFSALVIDTAAERLCWRISVPREHLASLYEGMLGGQAASSRGTLVVSAPFAATLEDPLPPDPPPDPPPGGATVSKPGDGGPKEEVPPFMATFAKLFARAGAASPVQIRVPGGGETPVTYTALLVPALDTVRG